MFAAILIVLTSGSHTFSAQQTSTYIRIDLRHPGPRVSPTLYGLFFEEINHAGDGGLYAEMVRNGSFLDGEKPTEWSSWGDVDVSLDSSHPLNEASSRSLKVNIRKAPAGVRNNGYWQMQVFKNQKYVLTFFARAEKVFAGKLSVSLEYPEYPLSPEVQIDSITSEWKRFSCTLTSAADDSAYLDIRAKSEGMFFLSAVSLQPLLTFKSRTNGLRTDLAEKLADIKPAFVRFPGGCYCEGEVLKDRFNWVGSSRVDLQACKLEYSIVSPK